MLTLTMTKINELKPHRDTGVGTNKISQCNRCRKVYYKEIIYCSVYPKIK